MFLSLHGAATAVTDGVPVGYNVLFIQAVKGFEDLDARYFIPTQWGTFHLGDEPAGFPGLDLTRHIEKNHLDPSRFSIMDIGQILPINSSRKQ